MTKKILTNLTFLSLALVLVGAGCVDSFAGSTTKLHDTLEETEKMVEENNKMVEETNSMMEDKGMMENEKAMEDAGEGMMEDKMEGEMMEENAVTIEVSGQNFSFSPNKITVKKGQKVTINFKSAQGFHDWVVDEFNARTEQVMSPGSSSVTFTADKTGEFEFYCSVGQHRAMGMTGTLVVEE